MSNDMLTGGGTILTMAAADSAADMPSLVTLLIGTKENTVTDNILLISFDTFAQNRVSSVVTLSGDRVSSLHPGSTVTVSLQAIVMDSRAVSGLKTLAKPAKLGEVSIQASIRAGMTGTGDYIIKGHLNSWRMIRGSTAGDLVATATLAMSFTGEIQ